MGSPRVGDSRRGGVRSQSTGSQVDIWRPPPPEIGSSVPAQAGATGRPPVSPRIKEINADRALRSHILQNTAADRYVRPAGCFYDKKQELAEVQLEEELGDIKAMHDDFSASQNVSKNDITLAKEVDARDAQMRSFLRTNAKLDVRKEHLDPAYANKSDNDIVDAVVKSRNFVGKMRELRLKRARILLNSSKGVQDCISPRDGFGGGGVDDPNWRATEKDSRYEMLMKSSGKDAAARVNHTIRNPTTYHINHMIRNGMDHRDMWRANAWTNTKQYGHQAGSTGHPGAPKVSSQHWSRPYQPAV